MDRSSRKAASAVAPPGAVDLARWGVGLVAYVRRQSPGVWEVVAADGNRLGVAADRATALVTARRHDLDPHDVH